MKESTRTPLLIRYVIVVAIAFICNVLVAAQMNGMNTEIAKHEEELRQMQKNIQEVRIDIANRSSTQYISEKAKALGFINNTEPIYVLEGTVAKK